MSDGRARERVRQICKGCGYPQRVCLCAVVAPVAAGVRVDVLQHPSEVGRAKGTVRLLRLAIPEVEVWAGEHADDFVGLRASLAAEPMSPLLFYPGEGAVELDVAVRPVGAARVVLLDGTWRKVHRMWSMNSWLAELPAIRVTGVASRYTIRRASRPDTLSTLETAAVALSWLRPGTDVAPLHALLDAMQRPWRERAPQHHR